VQRYAITDGRLWFSPGRDANERLAKACAELAADGVDFILVREKKLAPGELAGVCRLVLEAVRAAGSATKVLVAQRLDVAIAVGADGVHLSGQQGELTVAQVRALKPEAFVSVSCHTLADVRQARAGGASAVLFGPVFGKRVDGVEVTEGVGLEALREACETAGEVPVFALGGVGERNAASCVDVGASGVAAIRMFFPC